MQQRTVSIWSILSLVHQKNARAEKRPGGKKLSSEGYEEEVKARAQSAGIDMLRDVVEVIDDLDGGYVGKPKGITEIAWERVFFYETNVKR